MNQLKSMQERYQRFLRHRQAFDPGAKSWYRMERQGSAEEIYIYDGIGMFGVEAESFIADLNAIDAQEINLRINSPGGNVFDGTAIYNALLRHPAKVHVQIDGLAASMASIIALAGDTVEMAENAFFMIHMPWSMVIGDSEDMRKEAEILDKLSESAVRTYASRSDLTEDEVRAAMKEETWYSAEDAKAAGFVDSIYSGKKPESKFDLSVFAHAPEGYSAPRDFQADARGLEDILREVGMSKKQAKDYIHDLRLGRCEADPDGLREVGRIEDEELAALLQHRGAF